MDYRQTALWQDVLEIPAALRATLAADHGADRVAGLLGAPDVRRVVVTGNGAAYYVALGLWLASLDAGSAGGPELTAVPAGLVARGRFAWRSGDRLLAISSSGEFRDVIEAVAHGAPQPYAAVTATAGSTLGTGAGARALQTVLHQRAVTHTQALCGGIVLALLAWAEASADAALAELARSAPEVAESAIEAASAAAGEVADTPLPRAAIAFAGGAAWPAALETALLLKEVARVPCEGVETREGATSAMFGLGPEDLVLSIPTAGDELLAETEAACATSGARVLRLRGAEAVDGRLGLVAALPAGCALAADLALRAGHDPDQPAWTEAYYRVARGPSAAAP